MRSVGERRRAPRSLPIAVANLPERDFASYAAQPIAPYLSFWAEALRWLVAATPRVFPALSACLISSVSAHEKTAGHHFTRSAQFHSSAVAAFQRAIDAKPAHQSHSKEDERKLLGLFVILKNEFGLTDLFQVEAQRAGRE